MDNFIRYKYEIKKNNNFTLYLFIKLQYTRYILKCYKKLQQSIYKEHKQKINFNIFLNKLQSV